MKYIVRLSMALAIAMVVAGCIRNDIPYPKIQANFTAFAVVGESKPAEIDSSGCVVTVFLPEEANIYDVAVDSFALSKDTEIASGNLDSPLDLSSSYYVTLRMYQDYLWRIRASQNVERYFSVEGQIGTSTIDVPGRRVVATVGDHVKLASLRVLSCKLGAITAVTSPEIEGEKVNFSRPVVLSVENYGHIELWTIYIEQTTSPVTTVRADAWAKVAWVYGQAQAGKKNTVQYRIKGDTEWVTVPDSWLTHDQGDFHARITGLQTSTTYEARAVSDSDFGEAVEFTTTGTAQLPNCNFDEWWLDGKVWNPWAEGGASFWDTGNKGATTLGPSNTTPTDDTVDGSGRAARLETKFVGIGSIGKLAAGNIFAGSYVRTDGTNGILSFGRSFTLRPTKLKGYMKYKTAPISSVSSGFTDLKGRPDTCIIWCALIDSAEPFEIRTNPSNRHLFDPDGAEVVAYGKYEVGYDVDAYVPFEFDLNYKATNRVPKYILVTASASKYGDYFTGGNGAVLYLDNFELEYDY